MTKQIIKNRLSSLPLIAIVLASGVFGVTIGATAAKVQKSLGERFGTREPGTCTNTKAPAKGAITAALAKKYFICQTEGLSGENLYLVENVKVEVGGGIPYAAIRGQRSLNEIDVKHPVYPIRGSYLMYQCLDPVTAHAGPPGKNAASYNNPKATGYCYKTTFGDWRCHMADPNSTNKENARHNVAPPKGKNTGAGNKVVKATPANTKNAKPTAETKGKPDAENKPDVEDKSGVERDEDGFVKPDFSEMEKYFEIVKYEYNPVDGRVIVVVNAKKETNIFTWYMTAYDADGVKVSELSFNGNVTTPAIGEPTRIYSFVPNEREINKVTRIAVSRKLN